MRRQALLALPLLLLLLTACPGPSPATPLPVPSGLRATAGDGQVSLAWTASPDPRVARYLIRLESAGELPEERRVAAPATGTTVKQLTNGRAYSFRLAVESTDGLRSSLSPAVTATPKAPPPPNGGGEPDVATPTGLVLVAGDATITATWNANDEPDLAAYRVLWGTAPDALDQSQRVAAPTTTATLTGLTNDTTYFVAVVAEDAQGDTSARSLIEAATPTAAVLQPAIDGVTIEGQGSSLQARQGATLVLHVTGRRLGGLTGATIGTLPATVLAAADTGVDLQLAIPHGHALGALELALTTANGTATRPGAVEVTEISAAKNLKFLPSDANPGTRERPFLTVSRALSVAAAGDTVFLGVGTYEEGEAWPMTLGGDPFTLVPNVPDGVAIVGQARDLVVLQGPGAEANTSGLVLAGSASVRNLTLRQFDRALIHLFVGDEGYGGVITADDVAFAENYEGLHAHGALYVAVTGSSFLFNGSSGNGGGITLYNFGDATVRDTTLTGNAYGVWAGLARSVVLDAVVAEQSDFDGVYLANLYSSFITSVRAVDNRRHGINAVNAGEGSFTLKNSTVSGNDGNGVAIAGGAFASWDLGSYAAGGGQNVLSDNGGWQLFDGRDANTGVLLRAEGNVLQDFLLTPAAGTVTATSNFGLEQRFDSLKLWRIERIGNSIAF